MHLIIFSIYVVSFVRMGSYVCLSDAYLEMDVELHVWGTVHVRASLLS